MKMSLNADELDNLEDLDDAELAKLVRESLAKFRSKRGGRDTGADPGDIPSAGPANGDDPTTTGVRGGPKEGSRLQVDSVQRLREYGLSERRIQEIMTPHSASERDNDAAAKMIPSLGRLR